MSGKKWGKVGKPTGNGGDEIAVFTGTFEHSVDKKGRVALPSEWRDQVGDRVYVSIGIERGCLYVWKPEDFQDVVAESNEKALELDDEKREIQRGIIGVSARVEIDAQGRVLVPAKMRDRVGIGDRLRFIGTGRRGEAWVPEAHDAHVEKRADLVEIARSVARESRG